MNTTTVLHTSTAPSTSPKPGARACNGHAVKDTSGTSLAELCSLLGFPAIVGDDNMRFLRRRVKAGQWVYATGEPLDAVYAVFAGSVKTLLIDPAGNEQILGFPQKGDLLGMDGIFGNRHASHAIALTDCELIVIPFNELSQRGAAAASLENWLFRATSRELSREHSLVGLLGTLSADARVARFLVSLSERFAAAGYSPRSFRLAMTRKDIGNYLGLTLETASRTLSALDAAGYINVDQREVEIKDMGALRTLERITQLAKSPTPSEPTPSTGNSRRRSAINAASGSMWFGLAA